MTQSTPTSAHDLAFFACVAAWIQAVCAVGVLGLGIFAYLSWKDQEAAKTRAARAEIILNNVFSAVHCIESDIRTVYNPIPSDYEVDEFIKSAESTQSKCELEFRKLSLDAFWAFHLHPSAGRAVVELSEYLNRRKTKIALLKLYRRDRPSKRKDENNERNIRIYLSELGVSSFEENPFRPLTTEDKEAITDWAKIPNSKTILAGYLREVAGSLKPIITLRN